MAPFDIEIRRSGDGPNETFTVVDADHLGFFPDGEKVVGYQIVIADFDLVDDQDLGQQMTPANIPAGSTVVVIGLGRLFDSDLGTPADEYPWIVAGEELTALNSSLGPDAVLGASVTIMDSDGVTSTLNSDVTASGTMLYAGVEFVCIDVVIESQSGMQVSGIITATGR